MLSNPPIMIPNFVVGVLTILVEFESTSVAPDFCALAVLSATHS